ncbi:MAG: DUF3108 domain-containing protein [Alphaproteobacteria bacterium]
MSMMVRRCFLSLAVMAIGLVSVADRAKAADELDLYMVMTMAGVTAGSIKLSIDDQESETVSKLAMKSQGLFKFLTGYESQAIARSTGSTEGASPMPIRYESTYETNSGERRVEIAYDPETGAIDALGNWKEGKPRTTRVPAALQATTVDPLTAMVRFRHWIRDLRRDGGLQNIGVSEPAPKMLGLEVFDGRRRYRLEIGLLERVQVDHAGSRVPALRFRVDLETLAGFSKNDMLANWSSEDGHRWIEVIVTDDDDPVPISMATVGGSLKTTIYLRKICNGEDKCIKVDG